MKTNAALYGVLILLNIGLTQFAVELGAGHVPVPEAVRWIVPIVTALLTGLGALLPKLTAET